LEIASSSPLVPQAMQAAVYRGNRTVSVESIPTPPLGSGEILIRVESCGICHTDLKKIEQDLLAPPRVYGHETAGVIVAVDSAVGHLRVGDRVVVFHHVPCGNCFYCNRKLYAQCPIYKKVGVTAGFEPAGGGFSQYVRVMDWITARGVERIPEGVSFDRASFVEPLNTCLKGIVQSGLSANETVLIQGQGPIGLLFTMLALQIGANVISTDTIPLRRELSREFGAAMALDPLAGDVEKEVRRITDGRGADVVIAATSAPGLVQQALEYSRPGARILLFAQTAKGERIELSGADICVGERMLMGSYSASIDLQRQSADLVFSGRLPLERLISHQVPLADIVRGFELALHPGPDSLKIIVQPQRGTS
jgi:L-iditol 2-dehydrogenase